MSAGLVTRQMAGWLDRQIDDRQTDTQIDRHTDKYTHRQIDLRKNKPELDNDQRENAKNSRWL